MGILEISTNLLISNWLVFLTVKNSFLNSIRKIGYGWSRTVSILSGF